MNGVRPSLCFSLRHGSKRLQGGLAHGPAHSRLIASEAALSLAALAPVEAVASVRQLSAVE